MLAVSSPLFSTHGWPLMEEYPIAIYDQSYLFPSTLETSESLPLPPLQRSAEVDQYRYHYSNTPSPEGSGGGVGINDTKTLKMAKKLSHNASERDRRKKINSLYSSLRSLLPSTDQMKKLSNPATISRILSYIPEMQQEVEGLMRMKEELLTAMVGQEIQAHEEKKTKMISSASSSSSIVSASKLNQREMAIQISTNIINQNFLSQILILLEKEGFLLLNASSFESFDGKIFHNLHLQMGNNCRMEPEILSNRLLQMFP